jgi:putative DNA primase/helicase
MIDNTLLSAFDAQAACMYQPPLREPTDSHLDAVQDGVVLVCGGTLKPQPIDWIWSYWLAMGKLHILAGAPGQGKTTIALALAATLTVGGRWPDGTRCEVGNVLIWSGEDDPADTLLPRMMAMGADINRIFFVTGARVNGELTTFDPARDLRQLLQAIKDIGGIVLLVVDPIVSAVTGDSHKNTEVRRALQPLVDLASSCRCAVLGISHFSKGGHPPTRRAQGHTNETHT